MEDRADLRSVKVLHCPFLLSFSFEFGERPFPTASTYKLPIASAFLLDASGIHGIHINGREKDIQTCVDPPLDSTTPHAMVRLLTALYQGKLLKPATTAFLIQTLEQTKTFPGRIKGLLPPGVVVAHKTGTGDCATNDTGVITLPGRSGHLAIAVYLRGSKLSADKNDAIIARMSKAAYDEFSSK